MQGITRKLNLKKSLKFGLWEEPPVNNLYPAKHEDPSSIPSVTQSRVGWPRLETPALQRPSKVGL